MNTLIGKKVLLAVSGSVAAYKAAELARGLKRVEVQVKVVMTEGAKAFVTPLTFQALTGQRVYSELLDAEAEAGMGHIELARWPDLILIAPASANVIARLAHGLADDLLTTLCLATEKPIYLVPAMNQMMWQNSITQHNIAFLKQHGYQFLGPAEGEQACGDVGLGRMLEPEEIVDAICKLICRVGKAGPA